MRGTNHLLFALAGFSLMPPAAIAQARPPISLTISAPSLELASGCGFQVSVGVKNVSQAPIFYGQLPGGIDRPGQGHFLFAMHVIDAAGRPAPASAYAVWARRRISSGSRIVEQLRPGASINTEAIVTQMFDLSAPGKYEVWVTLRRGPYKDVKSNVLTITVAPPT